MPFSPRRRTLLIAGACAPLLAACASVPGVATPGVATPGVATPVAEAQAELAALEAAAGGRLGVGAIDTGDGRRLGHRADERFPMCSTFKAIAAAAILAHGKHVPGWLDQRVYYTKADLVTYSPITEKHLDDGMTVGELCAATIQYSDNAAANLLMAMIGGPGGVTGFARSMGDTVFRLDRWETELNTAIPGDPRDTATPAAMAALLRRVALDDGLPAAQRDQLQNWMRGNTTGDTRIRAAVPASWAVADKTGTGAYGSSNDIGIVFPPKGAPVVLALYYTQADQQAKADSEILAQATRIVMAAFARA
ncbi:class A beta-lactamase [Massilia genomosp. 1]|uniref:Beta-lactamase n=1 Tax=Massilia genomosp. 1 TaxID=2609280 RepID=A0ABX0MT31_9BURK|nr:class A beta-lactamase [Massilia genomosp. 1]NHZ63760.1 class A beta-lactamase [Massilia genomosp. 1]